MRVVGFSGSPRKNGNTDRLVTTILEGAAEAGAETKMVRLGDLTIKGCASCYYCKRDNHTLCMYADDMQQLYPDIYEADAFIIGSPVYMWQMCAQTKVFIDRLLPVLRPDDYSSRLEKRPDLVLAFTQGQPDTEVFTPYITGTKNMLGFLGFNVKEVIVAGGTHGKDDIATQPALIERARQTGIRLVKESKGQAVWR